MNVQFTDSLKATIMVEISNYQNRTISLPHNKFIKLIYFHSYIQKEYIKVINLSLRTKLY